MLRLLCACCASATGDLSDATALAHLMREVRPDEVYNLGAQSHVAVSFKMPKCVCECDAELRPKRAPRAARPDAHHSALACALHGAADLRGRPADRPTAPSGSMR